MATYYVDPAATGSNNGTSWTNAWTTFQSALTNAAAGDTVYCRGKETRTSALGQMTTAKSGTVSNYIQYIGCDSNGVARNGMFEIEGVTGDLPTNLILASHSYLRFENFIFNKASTAGFKRSTGGSWYFKKCIFKNFTGTASGMDNLYYDATYVELCVFRDNYKGVAESWNTQFRFCKFTNNSYGAFNNRSTNNFYGCIFNNNSILGMNFGGNASANTISGCVFDGHTNSTGHGLSGASMLHFSKVEFCRFTNNLTGLVMNQTQNIFEDYNFFYNNSTANKTNAPVISGINDIIGSSDGYVDKANDNFNLLASAEGLRIPVDIDWDL